MVEGYECVCALAFVVFFVFVFLHTSILDILRNTYPQLILRRHDVLTHVIPLLVLCVRRSATTSKPPTEEVNDMDRRHGAIFYWGTLGPGISEDNLRFITFPNIVSH